MQLRVKWHQEAAFNASISSVKSIFWSLFADVVFILFYAVSLLYSFYFSIYIVFSIFMLPSGVIEEYTSH